MQVLKDEIRAKILTAARKEFLAKGYNGASTRSIAAMANVTVSNLYNYFESKDRLFVAVVSPAIDAFNAMLQSRHGVNGVDVHEFLRENYMEDAISTYMSLIKEHSILLKILFFKAEGSSLENFKEDFTESHTMAVKRWHDHNRIYHPEMKIKHVDFLIHLHTVWMFTLFEEILQHRISNNDMRGIVEQYIRFQTAGWKELTRMG